MSRKDWNEHSNFRGFFFDRKKLHPGNAIYEKNDEFKKAGLELWVLSIFENFQEKPNTKVIIILNTRCFIVYVVSKSSKADLNWNVNQKKNSDSYYHIAIIIFFFLAKFFCPLSFNLKLCINNRVIMSIFSSFQFTPSCQPILRNHESTKPFLFLVMNNFVVTECPFRTGNQMTQTEKSRFRIRNFIELNGWHEQDIFFFF